MFSLIHHRSRSPKTWKRGHNKDVRVYRNFPSCAPSRNPKAKVSSQKRWFFRVLDLQPIKKRRCSWINKSGVVGKNIYNLGLTRMDILRVNAFVNGHINRGARLSSTVFVNWLTEPDCVVIRCPPPLIINYKDVSIVVLQRNIYINDEQNKFPLSSTKDLVLELYHLKLEQEGTVMMQERIEISYMCTYNLW